MAACLSACLHVYPNVRTNTPTGLEDVVELEEYTVRACVCVRACVRACVLACNALVLPIGAKILMH